MRDETHATIIKVIVAGSPERPRQKVADTLAQSGLYVVRQVDLIPLTEPLDAGVDAYFVDIDEESDEELERLDQLIAMAPCPVVFSDTSQWQDFSRWGRRIATKLFQSVKEYRKQKEALAVTQTAVKDAPDRLPECQGRSEALRETSNDTPSIMPFRDKAASEPEVISETGKASFTERGIPSLDRFGELVHDPHQKVWVLGASLGGPEVVKHFLAALPGIPPVCMILGQHIGENFTEILASQLNRVTGMKVVPAKSGDRVQNGVVYVAPIEGRLMIDREGVFSIVEETRPRLYKACIDYVMEEVALRYGKNASAIIFSGMGDDGAEGCKIIARVGGEVWAQSAETCIISSMPDSARATGYVSWTGSPEALAIKLMQHTTEEVERAMMFQGTESLTRH